MTAMKPEFALTNPTPLTFGAGGVKVLLLEGVGVPEAECEVASLVGGGEVSAEVPVVPVSVDEGGLVVPVAGGVDSVEGVISVGGALEASVVLGGGAGVSVVEAGGGAGVEMVEVT